MLTKEDKTFMDELKIVFIHTQLFTFSGVIPTFIK